MSGLDRLIRPRSVAIIGASTDPQKLTGRPLLYLQKYGFRGAVYPVNPRYPSIAGYACYASVAELPEPPDVAMVLLGADRVLEAVEQLSAAGTGAAIVVASGFGETGEAGRGLEARIRSAAGAMRVLGPNSIGLVNVADRIVLSASAALVMDELVAGGIALVSQSGGVLGSLLSRAYAQGIGFSKLAATGNECDLDVADFIDAFVDDAETKVIALYLEGLRRPDAFRRAAMRARQAKKPIVAFKVGRSAAGARAAVSHTGALAGSDAAYDALFRQLGIIRAERFSDLLDIPLALASGRSVRGNALAIITSTGGAASLLADAAGLKDFDTPPPDRATEERLLSLAIPGASLDRNPIDVTLAGVRADYFRHIIASVAESRTYDAVVVVLGSSALREPETASVPLREVCAQTKKPILCFVSPDAPQLLRQLNLAGVPTYAAPESCATVLAAMRRIGAAGSTAPPDVAPAKKVDTASLGLLRPGTLNEAESKALFARFGIPVIREIIAATPDEAVEAARSFAGPVVVKILSRDVTHKSEIGGVALGVAVAEVKATCRRLAEAFTRHVGHAAEGFLIQEFVTGGVEMILGFNRDPQLGVVVLVGMGGVAAELYRDTAVRLAPLARTDAEAMLDELKTAALLRGFRGRPRADIPALVEAMMAFSTMAVSLGDRLAEAEINPLFVLPQGRGVLAADGVVVVKPENAGS
jgi:acyl-CoA synthetase (NDP forming)